MDLGPAIRADLGRYGRTRMLQGRHLPGFRYTVAFRCVQQLGGLQGGIARRFMRREGRRWGYDIHPGAMIGPGLYLTGHPGGVVVSPLAVIGEGCSLSHGVTIGEVDGEAPVLGHNVHVATGAKIIGGVRVGNNVTIGANAVVTRDIEDDTVAAGVPARVISRKDQHRMTASQ
jgi:serine O-acetyltransferase